ncbi:MAG: peptidylprolyl isomerase [Planctomycetota bacterium]
MLLQALALLSLAVPSPTAPQAPAAAQDTAVLRVDGRDVSRARYLDWLVARRGEVLARSFAEHWLYEREARRLGVAEVADGVMAQVNAEIDERVEKAHQGDRSRWNEELERAFRTPAGRIAERRTQLEREHYLRNVTAVDRVVPEAKIEREWERKYGRSGRRFEVRILFRRFTSPPLSGLDRAQQDAERERLRGELAEELRALKARAEAGESFAALAREHSEDPRTKGRGGAPAEGMLDTAGWPDAVLDELAALEPSAISEPIFLLGGHWLVKLEKLHYTPLADVTDELRQQLIEAGPEQDEMAIEAQALWEAIEWEALPTLFLEQEEGRPRPGDEPVLTIDGESIPRAQFAHWLACFHGEIAARRFAETEAVLAKAREAGFSFSNEQVSARIEEDRTRMIDFYFGGDAERWERETIGARGTLDAWRREASLRALLDLSTEALLKQGRTITDERLRSEWETRYGPGGVSLRLRMILIDPVAPEIPSEATPEEARRLSEEAIEAARAKAADVAQRVEDGEDFASLAKRFSSDESTGENGGELPQGFDYHRLPQVLHGAIEALSSGETTPAVEVGVSTYLFELIGREEVAFDDVRAALLAELEAARPTMVEVAGFRNVMTRDMQVEVLPTLFE